MDHSVQDSIKEHALIIGASSPMALASANLFADAGVQVTLVGRKRPDTMHPFFEFDLLNANGIDELYSVIRQKQGPISKLCFFQRYRGEEPSLANEFKVTLNATETFVENFRKQEDFQEERTIVFVSSPADSKIAVEQPLSYHLAKASLSQMVRYYASILGPKRIRVNGVRPAIVWKKRAREYYETRPDLVSLYNRIIPRGGMGTVEDVARAIYYFSGEMSSYVTGQLLDIDGGLSLHEPGSLGRLGAEI